MSLKEKIEKILQEEKISSSGIEEYVDSFIERVSPGEPLHSLEYIINWYKNLRENCSMDIEEIAVNDLNGWVVDKSKGNICHHTGEFFSIIGLNIKNTTREVAGWMQPIVYQKEMGILGIICSEINGQRHYLLHAKAEPGNVEKLQLSPTLQATYSNLKQAHGGRLPRFAEFFINDGKSKVLYKKWLAEDGGRFYLKSNLNMLVEVDKEDLDNIPEDCIWITLRQIKDLLQYDNYIGPHVRSIICHL